MVREGVKSRDMLGKERSKDTLSGKERSKEALLGKETSKETLF